VIYSNMDSIAASTRALRQAFAFADRLPEEGRLVATARVRRIEGNVVEEEAAWRSLAALGRQETNYANFLLQHGRVQEAEVMARRAVASGAPNSITYWNLAEALAAQHKWAAVDSVTRIVQARMPDNLYRWFIPFSALVARRDYVAAERLMDTTEMRTLPAFENARCTMALLHGRLSRFAECSRQLPGYLDGNPTIAMAALRLTGDTAAARAAWTRFLAAPVASRGLDAYAGTIALLADAGRVREARQLYEEWRTRAGTANDPGFRTDSGRALGAMLAAEGKWKEALAAFAAWHAAPSQGARNWYNRGWPESAAIFRRMGQPDSAIALYERALGTASMVASMLYEVEWYPEALVALGTLHEQQGHRERAIEYYRTYLSLMKDADGALARQVATVRDRVFTLGGEPAGRP
jgi:tetratricopeptide (TPR) repeat protein